MNRLEESRGKPVVTRREGAIAAKFDDFQFDLRTWEIYGYRLRATSMFGKAGGIQAGDLDQVGRDVAFVGSADQVEWTGGGRNAEDGRAWASRYLGTRVISRDGASLGEVEDLVFEPGASRVVAVILTGERIALLDDSVATGSAAVVLENEDLAHALPKDRHGEMPASWWARVQRALQGEDPEDPPVPDED